MSKKIIGTLMSAAVLLASGTATGATVAVSNQITKGDFSSSLATGWATTGTTSSLTPNIRTVGDSINAGGGNGDQNTIFDTGNTAFFSTGSFAVLGDASNAITTNGNTDTSGLSVLTQTITLASTIAGNAVTSYALDLTFRWAFDGTDSSNSNNDSFGATLVAGTGNILSGSGSLISEATSGNNGAIGQRGSNFTRAFQLSPGTYILTFTLNENSSQNTNTAAAIDSVALAGTATTVDPAPVPVPAAAWLLGSALVGMVGIGRRKQV